MANCTITGVVYDANGAVKVGARLTVRPLGVTGILLHAASFPVTSIAGGVVSFVVVQGAQYSVQGNVLGLEDALTFTVPASSSVALESLVASSLNPASGLTVKDEGTALASLIGTLNFVGGGVAVTQASSGVATVTITSGGVVDSVFGRIGVVIAAINDYTWAQINKATSSLADITTRSASDLSSGTIPDARFPATLPAASGVNLTALNASNLAIGTVPLSRISGLTNTEISASAAIAYSKLNLTGAILNADLAGSIALSKLSISGTPNGTKFLRDDGSWQTAGGGGGLGGSTGATDNAILRADGTGGATAQSSGATIDDNGRVITGANANGGVYFGAAGAGISDSNNDGRLDFFAGGSSRMDLVDVGGGQWRLRFMGSAGIEAGNGGLLAGGSRVVSTRGAAVTDPAGGSVIDVEARAAIVAILDRIGHAAGHGLITR